MSEDHEKIALEKAKFKAEQEYRHQDLDLRRTELELKRIENKFFRNPLTIGVIAAALGLFGNLAVALVNGISQRQIEDRKAEATLITQTPYAHTSGVISIL